MIFTALLEASFSSIIAKLSEQVENTSHETLVLLTYLVANDLWMIEKANDSKELETIILSTAKMNGQYAGMNYDQAEFLNPDDENFQPSDDGLSWVCFNEAWDILKGISETV